MTTRTFLKTAASACLGAVVPAPVPEARVVFTGAMPDWTPTCYLLKIGEHWHFVDDGKAKPVPHPGIRITNLTVR